MTLMSPVRSRPGPPPGRAGTADLRRDRSSGASRASDRHGLDGRPRGGAVHLAVGLLDAGGQQSRDRAPTERWGDRGRPGGCSARGLGVGCVEPEPPGRRRGSLLCLSHQIRNLAYAVEADGHAGPVLAIELCHLLDRTGDADRDPRTYRGDSVHALLPECQAIYTADVT